MIQSEYVRISVSRLLVFYVMSQFFISVTLLSITERPGLLRTFSGIPLGIVEVRIFREWMKMCIVGG